MKIVTIRIYGLMTAISTTNVGKTRTLGNVETRLACEPLSTIFPPKLVGFQECCWMYIFGTPCWLHLTRTTLFVSGGKLLQHTMPSFLPLLQNKPLPKYQRRGDQFSEKNVGVHFDTYSSANVCFPPPNSESRCAASKKTSRTHTDFHVQKKDFPFPSIMNGVSRLHSHVYVDRAFLCPFLSHELRSSVHPH